MTARMRTTLNGLAVAVTIAAMPLVTSLRARGSGAQTSAQPAANVTPPGQSATRLPSGEWLLLGGVGAEQRAVLWNPERGAALPLAAAPQIPRAFHTATLLPDGTVLIVGGQRGGALAEVAEQFDPVVGTFTPIAVVGSVARATHTATLLTDGRLLIAGGSNGGPDALPTEIWDLGAHTATPVPGGAVDRASHHAEIMADGRVLMTEGRRASGDLAVNGDVVDPLGGGVVRVAVPRTEPAPAILAGSLPPNGAVDVPLESRVALRFSDAVLVSTLTSDSVVLSGPSGSVTTRLIVAEGGRLAFLSSIDPLEPGATYEVLVSGATTARGIPVVPASIAFTTVSRPTERNPAVEQEAWVPDASARGRGGWRTNRPPSPWESTEPLMAPSGVTAISGRTLTLDGQPLPDVTFSVEGNLHSVTSDRTGRFLLVLDVSTPGRRVLKIDGTTVTRRRRTYGFFEYGATIAAGQTTVLPFTIWMPALDTAHAVRIPSPTTREVVITTPYIPGLELHIPANTVLRGRDGKPVRDVSLTAIPVDRPPFPLAKNVDVPVYFTAQPGGAYVETAGTGPKGAWLVYPNYRGGKPGQLTQFFHYDPDARDWYVYGVGQVTPNGAQVVPNPTTRIYEFTGAMINYGQSPPGNGGKPGGKPEADPIDPATGVFLLHKTDLQLPDVIPLAFTRTYNSGDTLARPFGTGMTHPYAMFLWSAQQYTEADLILPEGGKVHYVRTSPGTLWADAVFVHQETGTTSATPTAFYKSTIVWNGLGWDLTLKDGTVYVFGENAPLQAIRDRYGNTVTITHASGQSGNVTRVTSPNGRWLAFTYDASDRITQVADNIGRTVGYTYDASGNLSTVTDPESNVTTYTYTASNQLATIKDGRNIVYLTNTYTNGRVTGQTLASPGDTYQFAYTVNGSGVITQTDITDPRGYVKRLAFNSDGYETSTITALGQPEQRTTATERQTGSNLVTATVDGLSRRTEYTYDSAGRALTVTRLAGTANAATTSYTYEPTFSQLTTLTDPMSHTWTLTYDASGRLTGASDPLTHHSTTSMNPQGQVTSVTDPLSHTWQFGYNGGDRTSTTSPIGAVWTRFLDSGGRVLTATDPLGHVTRTTVDKLNRPTAVIDSINGQTSFTYDANSNLTALTDALTHTTGYTYDSSDRVATRTDPLTHTATYTYDGNNNLTGTTDRKGQVTNRTYDPLNRLHTVTFADTSTITYTYDAGDRLTGIADSANGTIARTYDVLDRLTEEVSAEGTVDYTYDADGRRATMTVAGQAGISYTYDDVHRLTFITQGTDVVSFTYDNANRRGTLTYPNGIVATYGYDAANQLTSVSYSLGATTLGDLTYSYDAAGKRTSVGGSWARTGIPAALTSATYDAANRVTNWGGVWFTYDLNGNLTTDGTDTYVWNTREQLVSLDGSATMSFGYDGDRRRRQKTIGGTTTTLLFDGPNIAQELSGGVPTASLRTGFRVDETFSRSDSAGARVLLTDALGSTVALADGSGAIQTSYTYEPFGKSTTSGNANGNRVQFGGREADSSNFYYFRSRYYQTSSGRFLQEDLDGFVDGFNLYMYVGADPVDFGDPFGLAKSRKKCTGPARILGGNPSTTGRQGGFPNVTVTPGSAAVIPQQWGDSNRALRPYLSDISGTTVDGTPLFDGITDVIGGRSPIPGMNVRDALQLLFPDQLIIELPSGKDMGSGMQVSVWVPVEMRCPDGTHPE